MWRHRAGLGLLLLVGILVLGSAVSAEEFHMKDGSVIVGKIVAYEKDAFRVETNFGVAIIYKDRVARIEFPESAKKQPAARPPSSSASEPPSPQPASAKVAAARLAPPPAPPPPAKIVESVSTTEYVNETYGFRLFKPPTWRSYPQFVKPKSPVVAALGTPDETTLLLIGRESFDGSLDDYAQTAERSLEQLYDGYRSQAIKAAEVAGQPALERNFSGEADGRFWTGLAVYFARGRQCYTVLAVTAVPDNPDLQQAVLKKVLDTIEFLPN